MEQKRAKEDSDALFLIQRSHFLVTSVLTQGQLVAQENNTRNERREPSFMCEVQSSKKCTEFSKEIKIDIASSLPMGLPT